MASDERTPDAVSGDPGDAAALASVSTRERVSRTVLARGPVTAAELAVDLGITPAAVRRHLDALAADGLVRRGPLTAHPVAGRGPGRPASGWVATEAAHAAAPGAYDDLAAAALAALEREAGRGALERFAQARADELELRHRDRVEAAGPGPTARAGALAAGLAGDGYAARVAATGARQAGVQLCQGHCPVQSVAARYPELCEAETAAFSRLLGVPVRRLATLAAGHHACTTHVTTQVSAHPHPQTPARAAPPPAARTSAQTAPTPQGRSTTST